MEAKSKCWEKVEKVEEEEDDEVMVGEHEILKGRISSHPLYGLLVEAHLGCLKVLSLSLSLSAYQKTASMFITNLISAFSMRKWHWRILLTISIEINLSISLKF